MNNHLTSTWTTKRKAVVGALALVAVLGAGTAGLEMAQGTGDTKTTAADAVRSSTDARAASQGDASPTDATTGPVPAPLNDIEAQTEDIFDQVPNNGWATITADVATMQRDWKDYRAAAATDGIPTAVQRSFTQALDQLATASAGKDGAASRQAANDASAAAVEMLSHYDVGHPVQIGRLDVIGRQVLLDAQHQQFGSALQQIANARRELSDVQGSLSDHGGSQVLAQTNATLTQMAGLAAARDASGLSTQATVLLEIVDGMEQLYG